MAQYFLYLPALLRMMHCDMIYTRITCYMVRVIIHVVCSSCATYIHVHVQCMFALFSFLISLHYYLSPFSLPSSSEHHSTLPLIVHTMYMVFPPFLCNFTFFHHFCLSSPSYSHLFFTSNYPGFPPVNTALLSNGVPVILPIPSFSSSFYPPFYLHWYMLYIILYMWM